MKKTLSILACISMVAICSCTSSSVTPSPSSAGNSTTASAAPQIRKGMSKAQVIHTWGEPGGRQVSGSGEIWSYGGERWKRMIPYAGPFLNVQTSKVVFGSNGRVKDFRITDRGDVMSDMEGSGGGHSEW